MSQNKEMNRMSRMKLITNWSSYGSILKNCMRSAPTATIYCINILSNGKYISWKALPRVSSNKCKMKVSKKIVHVRIIKLYQSNVPTLIREQINHQIHKVKSLSKTNRKKYKQAGSADLLPKTVKQKTVSNSRKNY